MLQFKTNRQREEFPLVDSRLWVIGLAANGWFELQFGKSLTITECLRTEAERARLNASGVHVAGRAIDVRLKDLEEHEIEPLLLFLSRCFFREGTKPLFYRHGEGDNDHLHIQVPWRGPGTWKGFKV